MKTFKIKELVDLKLIDIINDAVILDLNDLKLESSEVDHENKEIKIKLETEINK